MLMPGYTSDREIVINKKKIRIDVVVVEQKI